MPNYRFYPLDKLDRISGPYSAGVCEDDQQALLWAEEQAADFGIEVWQGARLVARLVGSTLSDAAG
jgi:hypothetical protein